MEINQELLKSRMMRGALIGPADAEKPPLKYCAGKLDNNRPCRITVTNGDYCRRHQQEIDALEAGAPLLPGRIERQVKEDKKMAKRGTCKGCGRKDMTIVGANMCGTCYSKAKTAGTYPEPADIVPEKAVAEQLPNQPEEEKPEISAEAEISPVTPHPPQEPIEPCAEEQSPLSRLLTAAVPPPLPLPPCSLVVTLDAYRYQRLVEAEITPEDIVRLVTYLLDGELQRVNRAVA